MLEDENVYVNLRYSEAKIKEEFKDPLNKNGKSYSQAYDAIETNVNEYKFSPDKNKIIKEEEVEEEIS